MAVLLEVATLPTEILIDSVQVLYPGAPLTDSQEELRQLIWNYKHLLIGKGYALPPAARGAAFDIDFGDANLIA